jgi:hypothetical protein
LGAGIGVSCEISAPTAVTDAYNRLRHFKVRVPEGHFFAGRDDAVIWAKTRHCVLLLRAVRDEEAKRLTELNPPCGFPKLSKMFLGPYRHPKHPAMYADALRKAGLPE